MHRQTRNDSVIRLDRPQLAQKVDTTEFDEVLIVRRERPQCQSSVKGFAGANEIRSLFANIKHGGLSSTNRATRSEGKDYIA
jgi:hypothetical protein